MAKYFIDPNTHEIAYFTHSVKEFREKYGDLRYYQSKKAILEEFSPKQSESSLYELKESIYHDNLLPQQALEPYLEEEYFDEEFYDDYEPEEISFLDEVQLGYYEISELTKTQCVELQRALKDKRDYEGQPKVQYLSNEELNLYDKIQLRISEIIQSNPNRINSRLRRYPPDVLESIIAKFGG